MNAAALLAELEAAGVHLTRDGDRLRVRGNPDVDPTPYRERTQSSKPALLRALLAREVITGLTDQLETGWCWMRDHPHHPKHKAFLDRWTARLREYERTYAADRDNGDEYAQHPHQLP
jgi:hypothetical protein